MPPMRKASAVLPHVASGISCLAAAWIVFDTAAATLRARSSVPWFDEWDEVRLLRAWADGTLSIPAWLVMQHNEHRILFPRLVFLTDTFVFGGQGLLSLAAIFAVQAAQVVMLLSPLARVGLGSAGRWLVGASVVALLFSLRQAENFASGFQLQFFGVFAAATASFLLLSRAAAGAEQGRRWMPALVGSFALAGVATFTMANGIGAAFLLPVLAIAARLPPAVPAVASGWALLLAGTYFQGAPLGHQAGLFEPLHRPDLLFGYVSTYIGNVLQLDRLASAGTLGLVGLLLAAATAWRVLAHPPKPDTLFLAGTMAFVVLSACITATGRMAYGDLQAMSGRYVTGASIFWAATLVHLWTDPPTRPRGSAIRTVVVLSCVLLLFGLCRGQKAGRHWLRSQDYAQSDAGDLLLAGLDDPRVLRGVATEIDDVRRLAPVLRRMGISVFAGADAATLGRAVAASGDPAAPARCSGRIQAAVADSSLGPGGVRIDGTAWSADAGEVIRVILADRNGIAVGLAAGGAPAGDPRAWHGYAVAQVGADLTAYAVLPGRSLCRLDSVAVAFPGEVGDTARASSDPSRGARTGSPVPEGTPTVESPR